MPDYFDLPPSTADEAEPGSLEYAVLQWCEERLRRGIKFIESQVGYDKIAITLDEMFQYEMSGNVSYMPTAPGILSKTRADLISDIGEDVVAMLTDTRYFWKYSIHNPKYEYQIKLANKYAESWYTKYQIGLRIADVIRLYTYAGTGWAHLYYSRRIDDMMLEAEDPRNVFPVDPMDHHTIQTALGVIIRRPRTPDWVKEEYNKVVNPEVGTQGSFFGWLKRVIDGPGERGGPLSKKSKADKDIPGTPIVYVNTLYLHDKRINKVGKTVRMGKWDNNQPVNPWSYEVKPNRPLYPFGRMIVWGNGVMMSDGPSPYWSGKFPLVKFTLNPWPKTWFGKAPLWGCVPLNRSINANLQVIDDHCQQVAQPAMVADRNVAKSEVNRANTRAAGMKIRTNMASGKGIQIVPPPPLDAIIWEVIKWCEEKMQKIAGIVDPTAMAQLNQIPSDDTIDTIMKAMTPGIRLRSRIMEGAYTELAEHYLFSLFEFDTLEKRVSMFGPKGATAEDFDYYPRTMIPDNVPDGDPGDVASMLNSLGADNPPNMYQRTKMMLASAYTQYDPSSLLNTAAQAELMKYFLLAKMGYISVFTLMEKVGIMNFAPPSLDVPTDEIGRLALQQQLGIGMIANAQGRKATDAAPPAMGTNAAGPTITTS